MSYEITQEGQVREVQREGAKKESILGGMISRWEGCRIELGPLNSIQLSRNSRLKDMLRDNPFVSIQAPAAREGELPKKTKCNCKKSKCLKLYCECFSNQLFCSSECECNNCANHELNKAKVASLYQELGPRTSREEKGCKCTKSNCLKKYCDCFSRGVKCGDLCQCENCHNGRNDD